MSANESNSGSEIEIISPSKPQARPSTKPDRKMNPPRRSSRLSTPRLSVTPAGSPSPLTKETETPRVTPRATRTSTRSSTRPPSSNSSLKSIPSPRGSKKSTPASRSSSKSNVAPPDKRVSSLRQSKRRKTSGDSIYQSKETKTLDSPPALSKTAPEVSTILSQSQEIPSKISKQPHPSPKILESSEPQDSSAISAQPVDNDTSMTDPQEATEISDPLVELATSMDPSSKHSPEPDTLICSSKSTEIPDTEKLRSNLSSHEPESVPIPSLEPLPNVELTASPAAKLKATSIEPVPVSATSIEFEPTPASATSIEPTPISTSNEPVPITATSNESAPVTTAIASKSAIIIDLGSTDDDDDDHKRAESRNPRPTEDPMAIKESKTPSNIVAEASQDRIPPGRTLATGSKAPRRRAPRAVRAQKPLNQDDDDDDDFCNLSSRNPVQFVSKTLGLTAGDRRSASAVAPSSAAPETHSPERPTNVIYLSDEDSDKTGNSSPQSGSNIDIAQASTGRTRRRKKKSSSVKLPTWTMNKVLDSSSDEELSKKMKGKGRALSLTSDDSDDSDKPEPSKTTLAKSVKEKRAVRAPTPPPTINRQIIDQNLHALRCQLAVRSRSSAAHSMLQAQDDPSEAYGTLDDLDESSLDPALAQVRRQVMAANKGTTQSNHHEIGTQSQWSGHEIQISVRMVFDPRKVATSDPLEIEMYEKIFNITISARDPFSKVYEYLCAMNPRFTPDSIVLARDNIKLSPWVTPQSVDIMADTTLKAYETDVWQYIKSNHVRPNKCDTDNTNNDAHTNNNSSEALHQEASSNATPSGKTNNKKEEVGNNHIKLAVRDGNKHRIEMIVKPTTTASSIIRQFLKEMADGKITEEEIKDQLGRCKLEFDGEQLELTTKIQDTEIEEDEVLDLVFT